MDWLETEKKRKAEVRKRLSVEADRLLGLIVDELVRRGRAAEPAPKDKFKPSVKLLVLDGTVIPLSIEQKREMRGFSLHEYDRLDVSCDWVWGSSAACGYSGTNILLKAKTFGYSPKRVETFGFDVAKIADHLELWLKTQVAAEQKQELAETALHGWEAACDRLRAKGAAEDQVRATVKGIVVTLPALDERTAEKVLGLINPDFKA